MAAPTGHITIKEGSRLWPLVALMIDTYIDDLDDARVKQLEDMVHSWRLTDADGRRVTR